MLVEALARRCYGACKSWFKALSGLYQRRQGSLSKTLQEPGWPLKKMAKGEDESGLTSSFFFLL